jgi:alpha-tubulin suppressor-like RCC1 family protein
VILLFNYKFEDVYLGDDIVFALGKDKCLYGVGISNDCQISNYDEWDNMCIPTLQEIHSINDVKQVNFYSSSTFILKNDGTVWVCGQNYSGFFGFGNRLDIRNKFVQIPGATNIKKICVNSACLFLLKNDGTVWVCGQNGYGQLGLGHTNIIDVITQVPNIVAKDICCGREHALILKEDGSIWTCGNNYNGQLGYGDTITIPSKNVFTKVTNVSEVKEIYCGELSNYIIKNDGTVWVCGFNNFGQLGNGNTRSIYLFNKINVSNVKKIVAGTNTAYMLKNDGTVWSCGRNNVGQLGFNDTTNRSTFTQIPNIVAKDIECGPSCFVVIKEDGTAFCCGSISMQLGVANTNGYNYVRTLTQISNISNVKSIYVGTSSGFVITNDEKLLSCGTNDHGQLGIPFYNKYREFVKLNIDNIKKVYYSPSSYFILVLKNDNTLWAKGANWEGQFGTGNYNDAPEFIQIMNDVADTYVAEDYYMYNLYVKKLDGSIWSCGGNYCGEGGLGENISETLNFMQVDIDNVRDIYIGEECTFFVKEDGSLWGCGWTGYGQLGTGVDPDEVTETYNITQIPNMNNVKKLSCGSCFTFAIKEDGTLWGCGWNYDGCLGLGDEIDRYEFVQVPNINNVKDVKCSYDSTFILKNDNTVWACGDNYNGQLGLGDTNKKNVFTKVMDNAKSLEYIFNGISFISKNDGSVYGAGWSGHGELGIGNFNVINNTFVKINELSSENLKYIKQYNSCTIALYNDGIAYFTGDNEYNKSGFHQSLSVNEYFNKFTEYKLPDSFNKYDMIINNENVNVNHGYCGSGHEVLITEDGRIFIRGNNEHGQLGLGDKIDRDEYVELDKEINHIKAVREITIIKKRGEYYVTGKYVDDDFEKYDL